MPYVQVPRDLTKVKKKIIFNLTKRQIIGFGLALIFGLPTYFLTRNILGTDIALIIMILIMLPFFFVAMYEKNGIPAEKIFLNYILNKYFTKGKRIYITDNIYRNLNQKGSMPIDKSHAKKKTARTTIKQSKKTTKKTKKRKN